MFGKKVRIKIRYFALKHSLFLVSTRNDNISRGCMTKMEFPVGWGGPFCEPILENPEGIGGHRENPFCRGEGGTDIFWNYTFRKNFLSHKI